MSRFTFVTTFGFVLPTLVSSAFAEPVKVESVPIEVPHISSPVDGDPPPCAGEAVALTADAIAADMEMVAKPGVCAFGCGPDIAAALTSSVARAAARRASAWDSQGAANCAVTCAAIPPNAILSDPSEFLSKVRASRPVAVLMTDATFKGAWQPVAQGPSPAGAAAFHWDRENVFRPVNDRKSRKIMLQLLCKQFRNWSSIEDRQAKFSIWYDPQAQ